MSCCQCGHQPPAGSTFCNECGAKLVTTCASCGATPPPGSRFCNGCGATLAAEHTNSPEAAGIASSKGVPSAERDPRAYTPKHLADKILQSKSALEGERKRVTVLFADVKGSMELAEQLDPEEWHKILDRFFQNLNDGVHRFEGTVNQYTGDGIMALFGAPIAHEDHAQRACYAALHLRDGLRDLARDVKRRHGLDFATRIGLNSGEVIVGKIGDDLRMDYTAQGHTVGLAQRMEGLASGGSIYMTPDTAGLVAGYFESEDLGEFSIKGASEPMHVFELRGAGRARTRFDVSRSRGLTRFVGRDVDMATLEAALQQAQEGHGQVVGVVAEAGTGKSRLCFEFLARCRARGITVIEGHALAHGRNIPYLPMLQVFRAYYGITEQDDDRTVREKIAGRLLLLDEGFRDALPLQFEFFGVPDPERPVPRMDPDAKQRQLFSVLRRLVQDARSARGVAALIEDLHWLDPGSEVFLEQWVDAIAGSSSFLLLNFRPEYHAAWMQKSYYRQLPLAALGPEAIRKLLEDLLGNDPSTRGLAEAIYARTGGNPFFTEEVVQTLIESGHLQGTRGRYRLVTPIERLAVPASVQAVLAARIDRLPEREKRVLQAAAVIGKVFPEPILQAAAELPDGELRAALATLKAHEFVYEQALYPVAEYAFKHPLTQEVAYRSQLAERRARVHTAVARTIEEVDSGKLGESAALLAYHWEHAGDAGEAAKWHRRAAEWVGLNSPTEALRHWGSVRKLLDTLPETPESLAERAAVRAQIMNHLARMGDLEDQATSLFREGRELATRSGDTHVLSQVLNGFGSIRLYTGAVAEALDPLLESIRRADETEDIGLRVAVRYGPSSAYLVAGRLRECLAITEQGLRLAQGDHDLGADRIGFSPSLGLSCMHGVALSLTGNPSAGADELDRVIELARTLRQLTPLHISHNNHVRRCEVTGEAAPALAHGREAVDYAERAGNHLGRIYAYLSLGVANVLNGAWHDALEVLRTALEIGRERHLSMHEGGVLAAMAAAHRGLGDREKALALAEEAVTVCRRRGARLFELSALLTRIRALRETRGPQATKEIEAALAEAGAWLEMSGAKSYEPFLHIERAELARLLGDDAARRRELHEAHRLFTEIGAPIRAEQVAKELAG